MKTVHVIFKTHYDAGFTDLAQNVLDKYLNEFIPSAIDIALEINVDKDKPVFVWTLGSYLIHMFLKKQSKENIQKLEKAIEKGYIKWHGIAATFHSEAAHKRTIEHAINISLDLDARFNKRTIAAKMTDVPGHTKGIIPILASKGIEFLHIGVNFSSTIPAVPKVFRWQDDHDNEVLVCYDGSYGEATEIDGFDHILYFAHTIDNSGPQSIEHIKAQFDDIQKQYPDANIIASTLSDYAEQLVTYKDNLPVYKGEIGDSWIYGIGSDPYKMAAYKTLMRLQESWLNEGLIEGSQLYKSFNDILMMIPEHTWGMDVKRFLFDNINYDKKSFQQARQRTHLGDDVILPQYMYTKTNTLPELERIGYDFEKRSYRTYESSWQEKRDLISEAVSILPESMQTKANFELAKLRPTVAPKLDNGKPLQVNKKYQLDDYIVRINPLGAIDYLEKDGSVLANESHTIGSILYESIGYEQYEAFFATYTRERKKTYWWHVGDFGKFGLEQKPIPHLSKTFLPSINEITHQAYKTHHEILISLAMPEEATEMFGAPRSIFIHYKLSKQVELHVYTFDKDANRLPEALWCHINPLVGNPFKYEINKLGTFVSPYDVVFNGGRNNHGFEQIIRYRGADGSLELNALDCALVSPGNHKIMRFDNKLEDLNNGFYFNLHNNAWGTNFVSWYEDNSLFRFILNFNHTKTQ